MTTPAPLDPQAGTTAAFIHQLIIRDNESLVEYPWTLQIPFPLNWTDDQVNTIIQAVGAALPPNPYGWQITSSVNSTTTTITTDEHDYATVTVPAVPGAPNPPQPAATTS